MVLTTRNSLRAVGFAPILAGGMLVLASMGCAPAPEQPRDKGAGATAPPVLPPPSAVPEAPALPPAAPAQRDPEVDPLPIPELGAGEEPGADPLRWVPESYAYAPPLPEAESQFFEMKNRRPKNLEEPMVVLCRVIVTGGNFDWLADPDLVMTLRIAGGPEVTHTGGLNESVGFVSYPLAKVADGDSFDLKVLDQDITTREFIGHASEKFGGFPVEIETRHISASCRARSLDDLRSLATSCLERAGADYEKMLRSRPSPEAEDFGFPTARVSRMRSSLSCAAAYLGWKDPGVEERSRRLAGFEVAFSAKAREEVARKAASLPARGSPVDLGGLKISAAGVDCRPFTGINVFESAPAPLRLQEDGLVDCKVVLALENTGKRPIPLSRYEHIVGPVAQWRIATANGDTFDGGFGSGTCLPEDPSQGEHEIAPGARCELRIVPRDSVGSSGTLPGPPVMLRLDARGHKPVWMALQGI